VPAGRGDFERALGVRVAPYIAHIHAVLRRRGQPFGCVGPGWLERSLSIQELDGVVKGAQWDNVDTRHY
jgi:hypothetical protein